MNRWTSFFAYNLRAAWLTAVVLSLLLGALVMAVSMRTEQSQRLSLLQTEARRSSIEIMSSTLNGNLMGSITLLGFDDGDIKQEASNGLQSVDAHVQATLSTLGNAFGAEGVFIVGSDGIVKTSWDRASKPSTGLDVRFRPYFQTALKGQTSVYAAISMARGDRSLYFSAPVYSERARATTGIGAVVARTNLDQVDALLKGKFDQALLLSPQGVVFAATHEAWIGMIEGAATPERLKAIRELKQFGAMFEKTEPASLPVRALTGLQSWHGKRFAVASAPVQWRDPSGDWTLLVLEDLSTSVPMTLFLTRGVIMVLLGLFLSWMWVDMLRGRRSQAEAAAQLQSYAKQQEESAIFRTRLAQISTRLQRSESPEDLANLFLTEARDAFGVLQGVVYIVSLDAAQQLVRVGTSAFAVAPPQTLQLGEGVLGQCAKECKRQLILMPEDGYWTLRSGLGSTLPAAVFLAPMVLHDTLIGVVELALLQAPQEQTLSHLEEMVALLTNSMEILRRNRLLQQLGTKAGSGAAS